MAFFPGTRLGHYEVTAQIGVGGMGEVYRATDLDLKRAVAIKVLPTAVSTDADRLARFQREAEVLAALNHPNIAAIYGLERSEGVTALVMELVEGPTLADRIARGAIPVDEARHIARQVVEALEASHEQGIIHRDLKPANIKVRPDGIVKVLDFGLAKAMEPRGESLTSVSQVRTATAPAMTEAGLILGTAAYMSPEQARGMPVDKRADVWAFGCVLFEMLSGRRPFSGETTADTLAKVLEREPDWRALPAAVPRGIRELLRACLQKDQKDRLADAADVRVRIQESRTEASTLRRLFTRPGTLAAGALLLTLMGAVWWFAPRATPPGEHAPVSIVIADLENRTGDPTFDHALEPVLRMTLEGATFVSAYDRTQMRPRLGLSPPERLDDRLAREVAVRQGFGVVLTSSLDRKGDGYVIALKAAQAITGAIIASTEARASRKDDVLQATTNLTSQVRVALGDETTESSQIFAMTSLSTASLDVVSRFAAALEFSSRSRFPEAREQLLAAVKLDPTFGLGYQSLATVSRNLGRVQEAESYIDEALKYLDGMTERERHNTRGMKFRLAGDYPQCVRAYGEMIARYAGDIVAHNQRALCLTHLRKLREAMEEMRGVVTLVPNLPLFRTNLSWYASYAGDFRSAEREARAIRDPELYATHALAFALVGQGQVDQAVATYERLAAFGVRGASMAASGLGDAAVYQGRFSDAVRILGRGAEADLASKNLDAAAAKFASLAHAELLRGQSAAAIAAARKALFYRKSAPIRFLVARILIEAGEIAQAGPLIESLAAELQVEPRAHAKILEGVVALKEKDARKAVRLLTEANSLLDTWIGHFDLGRAYLEVPGEETSADSEFDACLTRRGEALSLFLDEEPTYGYLPPAYYYQGRVREKLKTAGYRESFRQYLQIRGRSGEDPLVNELHERVGLQR